MSARGGDIAMASRIGAEATMTELFLRTNPTPRGRILLDAREAPLGDVDRLARGQPMQTPEGLALNPWLRRPRFAPTR